VAEKSLGSDILCDGGDVSPEKREFKPKKSVRGVTHTTELISYKVVTIWEASSG